MHKVEQNALIRRQPSADVTGGFHNNALASATQSTARSPAHNLLAAALMSPTVGGQGKTRPCYLEEWAKVIFEHELQKPFWTIDDGVPILLGLSPDIATPEELASNRLRDIEACEAMRIRRLVSDAQLIGDLPTRIRPVQFINWALAQHISVPPRLIALALERGMPIVGRTNPIDAWKKKCGELIEQAKAAVRAREDNIATLQAELQARSEEVFRLRRELECRDHKISQIEAAQMVEQPPEKTNTAGLSRKYNGTSMWLYGLAKATCGVEISAMKKPNLKKLFAAFESVDMHPDDETLESHLRHGAEQAARHAKSPK